MPLFGNREDERRRKTAADDNPRDASLQDELSELVAAGKRSDVDKAIVEAEEAVNAAKNADIRGLKMIEQGRCPECGARTDTFLYTSVCASCGWYRRAVPDVGSCVVYLVDGKEVHCDRVYTVRDEQILCVNDGVVRTQLNQREVKRIDYDWTEHELDEARTRAQKQREGACSWCERSLAEAEEEDAPYDEYVAFGLMQEHYIFCSKRCLEAFRRQYPSRIHRNCYETDCRTCTQCIKRFDTDGFKRVVLL
jgi:hypothetical protein